MSCQENCELCAKEIERKGYSSTIWKKNEDGYSMCGTCYNKLGCDPICESCF